MAPETVTVSFEALNEMARAVGEADWRRKQLTQKELRDWCSDEDLLGTFARLNQAFAALSNFAGIAQ
jgi:hypothetical protein